jgi:hypothetical protein
VDYTWTCSCCGESFDTLPFNYAFHAPANWSGLSEEERDRRATLTADLCIIDEAEFYVRGCVEVPVLDGPEPLVWGVWISVSQESYRYILDKWNAEIPADEPPRFGWLCNWINGYPEPDGIRCNVFLRSGNLRPRVVLEPTDYPLAIEQHRGVRLDRIKEIAARGH